MRISKVKLNNYVCFNDAPEFELGPGINFIVGKNNAGKTALIDALCGRPGVPYKMPRYRSGPTTVTGDANVTSWTIEYQFSEHEVLQLIPKEGTANEGYRFYVPWSLLDENLTATPEENTKELIGDGFTLEVKYLGKVVDRYSFRRFDQFRINPNHDRVGLRHFVLNSDMTYRLTGESGELSLYQLEHNWKSFPDSVRNKQFRFDSQRMFDASSEPKPNMLLQSDARNLPQVVHEWKSGDDHNFNEYLGLIRRVLPDVSTVLSPPIGNRQIGLEIQFGSSSASQSFLDIPYQSCGDGTRQILAMLYVLVRYKDPVVIVIDEPQSFLHPGALRELLLVFEDYSRHQYIVTTHSPNAIMSVQKKRILLVKHEDLVSTVQGVDVADNAELEEALEELGTKRSDIFGMDAVIWVEGETDEFCIRHIMNKCGGLQDGVNILPLVHTGDLEDKNHAKVAVQIYERLSGGIGVLPSVLAFVFDKDKESSLDSLPLAYRKRVETLPRINYESFLIDPITIAQLLKKYGVEGKRDHTPDSIKQWIFENNGGHQFDSIDWLHTVNGAAFCRSCFSHWAESAMTMRKRGTAS